MPAGSSSLQSLLSHGCTLELLQVSCRRRQAFPHQVDGLDFACSVIKWPPPSSREDGARSLDFPPAASLEAEGGCLGALLLQTQILSTFWHIPVLGAVGACSTNPVVVPTFFRTSRSAGTAFPYRTVGFTALIRAFHFQAECCAEIPLLSMRPFHAVNILIAFMCWVSAWCE